MDQVSLWIEARNAVTPSLVEGWSNADFYKLLQMYERKTSLTNLAMFFDKTKGQIAGLIDRAVQKGLVKRHGAVQKAQPVKEVKSVAILPFNEAAFVKRLASKPKKRRVRLRLIDGTQQVTFAQLEPHHCRFPFGDPRQPDFRFCGCRRVLQKPYCEAHVAIAGRMYEQQKLG